MKRYPASVYGPKGWGDLDDRKTVYTQEEEEAERANGYRRLTDPFFTGEKPKGEEKPADAPETVVVEGGDDPVADTESSDELTEEQIAEILASDESATVLGERYGVKWQKIGAIRRHNK